MAERPDPPNVLLVACDEMRGMAMACAGDPNVATPHLDRLAAEGAHWRALYTPSPLCCPARAAMQTGFYPHNAGFAYDNRGALRDDVPTLAERFAAGGYDTAHIDEAVGRLLAALDRADLAERTVVVFTSDHGDMLFSHDFRYKRRIHEESSRVPFLVRHPPTVAAGETIDELGSLVDLVPTLLDLAGLEAPATEGLSLAPRLRAEAPAPRASVPMGCHWLGCRSRGGWHAKRPWRGLRTRRHAATFLEDEGRAVPVELFDLERDPYQLENRVAEAAQRETLAALWRDLHAHLAATGDAPFAGLRLAEADPALPVCADAERAA